MRHTVVVIRRTHILPELADTGACVRGWVLCCDLLHGPMHIASAAYTTRRCTGFVRSVHRSL